MKVKIGNYPKYWGPYQIAELILFWIPKYDEEYNQTKAYDKYVDGLGKLLADTPLDTVCEWIHSKRKKTVKIKTDPWDHWNAGITMAMLCLPILKDLRENRNGIPWTEHADGPWYYRFLRYEDEYAWDERGSYCDKRWRWIMDEIIWSLEQIASDRDWEDVYFKLDDELREWDKEGHLKHQEKINNGLRLLGKYWERMWD